MPVRKITPFEPVAELVGAEFRKGAAYTNWRPEGSGDWLLIHTIAGSGRFTTTAGCHDTQPGEVVLFTPQELQDYRTAPGAGAWHLLWVHFTPKPLWRPWLRWPVSPLGLRLLHLESGEIREHFVAALQRMVRIARRQLPVARDLAANALEEALLWAHVVASADPWMSMDARVRKAIDYLIAHEREPFSLEKLARHGGASISRLAFLFKQDTGLSPQQFLERHRMQHAAQLLRLTSLSIGEVASAAGYPEPFYFSNRFRRFSGQSPSEYRRRR